MAATCGPLSHRRYGGGSPTRLLGYFGYSDSGPRMSMAPHEQGVFQGFKFNQRELPQGLSRCFTTVSTSMLSAYGGIVVLPECLTVSGSDSARHRTRPALPGRVLRYGRLSALGLLLSHRHSVMSATTLAACRGCSGTLPAVTDLYFRLALRSMLPSSNAETFSCHTI